MERISNLNGTNLKFECKEPLTLMEKISNFNEKKSLILMDRISNFNGENL